jgi:hypothetical protein
MELKDVILSTLAELDSVEPEETVSKIVAESLINKEEKKEESKDFVAPKSLGTNDEKLFLESIQERLLVLFEGFQAPNNAKVEAKVDLTLNFLEYLLATIENRIQIIENKDKE